jgi:hypothetical protein
MPAKKRKPGRPALSNGETPIRALRLPDELWTAVDRWCRRQKDKPTKPEGVRRLLAFALALNPQLDDEEDE